VRRRAVWFSRDAGMARCPALMIKFDFFTMHLMAIV
jgi:hypothetical protein